MVLLYTYTLLYWHVGDFTVFEMISFLLLLIYCFIMQQLKYRKAMSNVKKSTVHGTKARKSHHRQDLDGTALFRVKGAMLTLNFEWWPCDYPWWKRCTVPPERVLTVIFLNEMLSKYIKILQVHYKLGVAFLTIWTDFSNSWGTANEVMVVWPSGHAPVWNQTIWNHIRKDLVKCLIA